MNDATRPRFASPLSSAAARLRRTWARLRPFLRRGARPRLLLAAATLAGLAGVAWFSVSALTRIDTMEARALRMAWGLERGDEVCSLEGTPRCSFDDREQAVADREWGREQRVRVAVLQELEARVSHALGAVQQASVELATPSGASGRLEALLAATVPDLRPIDAGDPAARRAELAAAATTDECDLVHWDGMGFATGCDRGRLRSAVHAAPGSPERPAAQQLRALLAGQETRLHGYLARIQARLAADGVTAWSPVSTTNRADALRGLRGEADARGLDDEPPDGGALLGWLAVDEGVAGELPIGTTLAALARQSDRDLLRAIEDSGARVWHAALREDFTAHVRPTVRYRSPVSEVARLRIFGGICLALAALFFVVVGPVIAATTTAREREAGTLPVLRMTGLDADDLGLAMAVGPNLWALVAGGGLIGLACVCVALAGELTALLAPVAVLALAALAAHLLAIAAGDALGQRVNALVVGGLFGTALLVPGVAGVAMLATAPMGTGLLLGPLPAAVAGGLALTGLTPFSDALTAGTADLGVAMLGTTLAAHMGAGLVSLASWRRRVEQPWAALLRPVDFAGLGIAAVVCATLAVLDLSEHVDVQSFDGTNLLLAAAAAVLLPGLAWMMVASLRRPARARAAVSVEETRRAFVRLQAALATAVLGLGAAYQLVLLRTGLLDVDAEPMWATLTQALLVVETTAATALLAARRRHGRGVVWATGGFVLALQLGLTAVVYRLEASFVADTHRAGAPFLVGMDASPYWLAFVVLAWAAGLGLMLAALLRERDRTRASAQTHEEDADLDSDEETAASGDSASELEDRPSRKWLH